MNIMAGCEKERGKQDQSSRLRMQAGEFHL
jgi:hypothetical protein